jgi:hypothetical protein
MTKTVKLMFFKVVNATEFVIERVQRKVRLFPSNEDFIKIGPQCICVMAEETTLYPHLVLEMHRLKTPLRYAFTLKLTTTLQRI